MPEVTELLVGVAAFLYVWTNRRRHAPTNEPVRDQERLRGLDENIGKRRPGFAALYPLGYNWPLGRNQHGTHVTDGEAPRR